MSNTIFGELGFTPGCIRESFNRHRQFVMRTRRIRICISYAPVSARFIVPGQMTLPTRGHTVSGGIDEQKVQYSQRYSNGLRSFSKTTTERSRRTKIRDSLDNETKDRGLDPDGCWRIDAGTNEAGERRRKRLKTIVSGYADF